MELTGNQFNEIQKRLSRAFYQVAKEIGRSYSTLFREDDRNRKEILALLVLSRASTAMGLIQAASTFFHENFDCSKIDQLIHKFDVYYNEVLTSVLTSHSHQWSDIGYRDLRDHLIAMSPMFLAETTTITEFLPD